MSRPLYATVSLLLCLVLVFSGCGGGDVLLGEQVVNQDGYYSFGYLQFTGTRKVNITLTEDKDVNIGILTTRGHLSIEVKGDPVRFPEGKESYYSGTDLPTGNWWLPLPKGSYIFEITGKKHIGAVSLSYGMSDKSPENPEELPSSLW